MFSIMFGIFLCLSLNQQINCIPIPSPSPSSTTTSTTTTVETTTLNVASQQNDSISEEEVTMNCLMEAIMAMSNNGKTVSEFCKNFFVVQNEDQSDAETNDDVNVMPATADLELQDELNDLTSQLRGIDADYDADNENDVLGLKRDSSNAESVDIGKGETGNNQMTDDADQTPNDDNTMDGDDVINAPFITSLNEEDGEFLVIPLNYLKKEILDGENLFDFYPEENQKEEGNRREDDVEKGKGQDVNGSTREALAPSNNKYDVTNQNNDVQATWSDNTMEGDDAVITEKEMAIMYRLELDLSRLGEDLKILNIRPSSLKD